MIFLIIGVVVGIYIIRFSLQGSIGESASTIASILNTVQITVFNILYGNLAYFLTTRENHRTDTKFEDSLILKSFSFQFINSYSSFFFLAFIAQYLDKPDGVDDDSVVGQCGASTCMPSLTTNLAILFGTRIFVNNVIDLATAYSTFITKLRNESKNIASNVVLTNPEFNYYMNPFSIINENIKNYSDCAIQFGFSSLFVMALPCATFLNLISSAVKVRLTVFKYTKVSFHFINYYSPYLFYFFILINIYKYSYINVQFLLELRILVHGLESLISSFLLLLVLILP